MKHPMFALPFALMLDPFAACCLAASPNVAATPMPSPAEAPSPAEIVAGSPPGDWESIPNSQILEMRLGNGRIVTIQLAPDFAPDYVANIRTLVRANWWAGTAITRVQDNYVVQWGDPGAETPKARPLPRGVLPVGGDAYSRALDGPALSKLGIHPLPWRDAYASLIGFAGGWPVASDGRRVWLPHCYGMVGVGRGMPPDQGTGAELYVVIGSPPRHLDRNIGVVGRVIDGMDALSSLPRGTGPLGTYTKPEDYVPVTSITQPRESQWQMMRITSASFARYIEARANRRDPFFITPAGGVDLCNLPVPVRRRRQ